MQKIKTIFLLTICFKSQIIFSQNVSIATDISVLRNFKKDQKFWSWGQNIQMDFHLTNKNAAYVAACYYAEGSFENSLTATAKSSSTSPQQISFINSSLVRLREFALGWKHYLRGHCDDETGWSLYNFAGFGLLFGKATNTYSTPVDTSLYTALPTKGIGYFKRLTIDLGLGWEMQLGGDIYVYTEGRIWIPTSDYPSQFLFINNHAPLAGTCNAGLRILF